MSRTGIFLCAMSEIERMKVEGMMDIFQRVKSLRASRPHMVSSAVSLINQYMQESVYAEHYLICFRD